MPMPHLSHKTRGDVQLILEILGGKMIANRENCGKIALFQILQKCLTPCEHIVRAHAMVLEVHDSDEGPPLCLGGPMTRKLFKNIAPPIKALIFILQSTFIDSGYLRLRS